MTTPRAHFLALAHPPRPSFMQDGTPEERATMGQHVAFLQELLGQGKVLIAGPCLDGAYGVAVFEVADRAELDAILARDPARNLFARYEIHPMMVGLFAR